MCATDTVGGCGKIQELQDQTGALRAAHAADMQRLERLTRSLGALLSLPEAIPRATITAEEPDTALWDDPDGTYPATLVVRLEYDRGLDRLGGKAWNQLVEAIDALREASERTEKSWQEVVRNSTSKIPMDIMEQRRGAVVKAQLGGGTSRFTVPVHLARRYLKRDAVPWVAVASHVVTEGRLKHKMVQEHVLATRPALIVSQKMEGGVLSVTIMETPARRDRMVLQSAIPARDFCKSLRGELRFVPFGQMPPRKVEFRSAGGAR